MTFRVSGAARATIGARANQEDAFAIWTPRADAQNGGSPQLLAVVADGMGGHAGGEVASRLACDAFVAAFTQRDGAVSDRLNAALDEANASLARRVAEDGKLRGMGSTLVAASLDETGLRWASVGDSLLLLWRGQEMRRLNADHSLGAYLDFEVQNNRITAQEAARNPRRNALRSALTGKRIDIRDLSAGPYQMKAGDWLIVASDGLATLSNDEIGNIVETGREGLPDQVAERLIAAVIAKDQRAQDNATVIALKIEGDTCALPEEERPTRIVRLTGEAASVDDDGRTQTAKPVASQAIHASAFGGYTGFALVAGFGVMFLIGWLIRAVLD